MKREKDFFLKKTLVRLVGFVRPDVSFTASFFSFLFLDLELPFSLSGGFEVSYTDFLCATACIYLKISTEKNYGQAGVSLCTRITTLGVEKSIVRGGQ